MEHVKFNINEISRKELVLISAKAVAKGADFLMFENDINDKRTIFAGKSIDPTTLMMYDGKEFVKYEDPLINVRIYTAAAWKGYKVGNVEYSEAFDISVDNTSEVGDDCECLSCQLDRKDENTRNFIKGLLNDRSTGNSIMELLVERFSKELKKADNVNKGPTVIPEALELYVTGYLGMIIDTVKVIDGTEVMKEAKEAAIKGNFVNPHKSTYMH